MSSDQMSPADPRLAFLTAASTAEIDPAAVGVKAGNLMRMADAGLPVPPGFVLTTDVCADYHAHGCRLAPDVLALIRQGVSHLERSTGRRFGAERHPLLVAVRSGAAVSMPGILDTILDIGLCDRTLPGLLRATGDPAFVWDSYRRLIQGYAEVVERCPAEPFGAVLEQARRRHGAPVVSELDVSALRQVTADFLKVYQAEAGRPFPQDPLRQLLGAVEAVLQSWNAGRAVQYRRLEGLSDLPGTAVTVQTMVFGNMGVTSGSGVGFTRDPATGENRLYLDFLPNAQGEDIVGGRMTAPDPGPLIAAVPGLAGQLEAARRNLEEVFRDGQDFEFTVEEGRLWLLQTRTAKRTPWAALQIACDLVEDGVIDQATALERLRGYQLDKITRVRLGSGGRVTPIARGTPASPGVATGRIALTVEAALRQAERREPVILVREHASPQDLARLADCEGLLTASGARTSHAAVVARERGIVCLVSCQSLDIDVAARQLRIGESVLTEDGDLTIDGTEGAVYPGSPELAEERPLDLIKRVRTWQRRSGSAGHSRQRASSGDLPRCASRPDRVAGEPSR